MMRINAGVCRGILLLVVMAALTDTGQAQTGTLADASIAAWGDNSAGQFDVPSGYDFAQLAARAAFALKLDGTLEAWGGGVVPTGNNFIQVAAGWSSHALALRSDGSLEVWGDNEYGQCNVPPGTYLQAAGGGHHSVAVRSNGTLAAWGGNGQGQCNVPSGTFMQAGGGYEHSVGLRTDGTLAAWGDTSYGLSTPPSGNFTTISAGNQHNLAVRADGSLAAWGRNNQGQCNVPSGNNFTDVSAGGYHSLALRSDGSIAAWGYDYYGQVSDTPTTGYFFAVSAGGHTNYALRARDVYDGDLLVSGVGRRATLNRSVAVAGNASIQTTMGMVNNPTMTVAGLMTVTSSGGINGTGTISGQVKNGGHVRGIGTGQRLTFSAPYRVSGTGNFENTLIQGTFAPGESPAIVNGTNQGFGGTVEIELGGTVPGLGNGHHDQINDAASILLAGSPQLSILPWDNFVPEVGDQFEIMTWATGLSGTFGSVQVDPWFATQGISFDVQYNNVGGAGGLTLTAVPEPSTFVLLGFGAASLLGFGWRYKIASKVLRCMILLQKGGDVAVGYD